MRGSASIPGPADGRAVSLGGVVALLAAPLLCNALGGWAPSLPSRQWLEDEFHGTVVAYKVTPAGGFVAIADGRRVVFDKLRANFWSFNNRPPFWRWQMVGLGHGAPVVGDAVTAALSHGGIRPGQAATVAQASCPGYLGDDCGTPPWIFGQVNDPAAVALDVVRGGTTTCYPVAAPGFAVQLDPLDRGPAPTAYRWLDADGNVVWSAPSVVEGRWPGDVCVRKDGTNRESRERRQIRGAPFPRSTLMNGDAHP